MILFGHPNGNPNAHHAALAHYETGRLDAFVVPWFPSASALSTIQAFPPARAMAARLSRRRFEPLADAPKIQGRMGEWRRLAIRAFGGGDEGLSYEANDWLMREMARAARRRSVTAIHSYEDASLWPFLEAKKLGKACIYDMPIGYYPAWEDTQKALAIRYVEWLPSTGLSSSHHVRPEQKRREMELADVVLVPSSFADKTVRAFHPRKKLARATYGVDLDFWHPPRERTDDRPLRFMYAGQLSLRKGIPMLIEAWEMADLRHAQLDLVGIWQLAEHKRSTLPRGVNVWPPCSRDGLRERYHAADVFVFPSFFEGFGLVLLEAMACGLPVISSDASFAADAVDDSNGAVFPVGAVDALVEHLRAFANRRDSLAALGAQARARAESHTWERYRQMLSDAVVPFC